MDFEGIEIVCPMCRRDLRGSGSALRCAGCDRSYPVVAGIPDLRLWPDPYIGLEEDRSKGERLAAACAGLDFEASIERYYALTTVVPPFQAKLFMRGLLAAVPRSMHSLDGWERGSPADPGSTLLDVGCGSAPLLVAARARHRRVVGVDIAFRWLVVARSRLREAGVDAPLICACAEALPFPDDHFDRVAMDSTLELLRDAPLGALEAFRVMRAGGRLFAATPNRRSLGPDPHVGVPAGGWWPDSLLAAYARWRGAVPPHRHLLSAGELKRLLRAAGFDGIDVYVPGIPPAQRDRFGPVARGAIDAYNVAARSAIGRSLLRHVGPLLHARATKPELAGALPTRLTPTGLPAGEPGPA